MFREMRRIKQLLPEEITIDVLKKCGTGTLGVIAENGYPYTVPVNFVYTDGKIYMHGAKVGQKVDSIKANDKVSFTVIEKDELHPEKLTTFFRSVIVFGKAHLVEDNDEKLKVMTAICDKFCKYTPASIINEELKDLSNAGIICIEIEHMTGKEHMELVKIREGK